MAYKLNIKPSVNLNIQSDVVKNITTDYTLHISASKDWASDNRNYTKGSEKYITNINYNTLNVTELYKYACKPFESGSKVIDTFLNENGHVWSSYSVVTSSFTENQYWSGFVSASDADDDPLTFSLSGQDANLLRIQGFQSGANISFIDF